jgi:hypothetical protein
MLMQVIKLKLYSHSSGSRLSRSPINGRSPRSSQVVGPGRFWRRTPFLASQPKSTPSSPLWKVIPQISTHSHQNSILSQEHGQFLLYLIDIVDTRLRSLVGDRTATTLNGLSGYWGSDNCSCTHDLNLRIQFPLFGSPLWWITCQIYYPEQVIHVLIDSCFDFFSMTVSDLGRRDVEPLGDCSE